MKIEEKVEILKKVLGKVEINFDSEQDRIDFILDICNAYKDELTKESNELKEQLIVSDKAHQIACNGWAEEEKKFTDYKENLLLKAEQYEREQEYIYEKGINSEFKENDHSILIGITRIVSLIRRFNKA
jgi:hypothetical protein